MPPELTAAARDRGFGTIAAAVAAARPFFLLAEAGIAPAGRRMTRCWTARPGEPARDAVSDLAALDRGGQARSSPARLRRVSRPGRRLGVRPPADRQDGAAAAPGDPPDGDHHGRAG